ncbi:hypothetical protein IEQ34_022612 [Dendrobium chrysotoxum]|uniref:RING-type domain-containing protein n=1 Tax=Dendrobium chrysotoxum TaxID=161865 RepID=A0AAV7FY77_DENCH|nr:hypothetical protein IEQ34_022612 [Dendrobium chrysotoxum]
MPIVSSRRLSPLLLYSLRFSDSFLRRRWEAVGVSDRRRRIGSRKSKGSMTDFETADAMDLEKHDISEDLKAVSCSICLDLVLDRGERSIARLQCGHEFHLDCIGSAFNAKGVMQCPNCRKVEKGRWLYSNGHRLSSDFDLDGWITEDIYDLTYSELPLGYQWCPFGGFTQLASLFEEMESQPNHESLGSSSFGDHSSGSGSSHVCPYQALHGFAHHPMHTAPSSSSDSVLENSHFHRHPTGLGGQPQAEMLNPHSFSSTDPPNHNWQQQPPPLPVPLATNSEQPTSQYGLRLPRNDTNNPQRLGSFMHAHPLPHGSISARSGSNLVAGSMAPPVLGEVRTHARGNGSHIYQQSVSSSPSHSSPFPPIRRPRPRGVTLISTSTSTDIGGFYGFSVSTSTNRSLQDSGRHFDRYYGWGREGFAPLPWIPLDGESRWWGPFNPNQPPQSGSFLQRGGTTSDRVAQSRSENGYNHQRIPPPTRMPPPPPYM